MNQIGLVWDISNNISALRDWLLLQQEINMKSLKDLKNTDIVKLILNIWWILKNIFNIKLITQKNKDKYFFVKISQEDLMQQKDMIKIYFRFKKMIK